MIDYGTYEVQKDPAGKFIVTEEISGKQREFDNIADLVAFIERDLNDVEAGQG